MRAREYTTRSDEAVERLSGAQKAELGKLAAQLSVWRDCLTVDVLVTFEVADWCGPRGLNGVWCWLPVTGSHVAGVLTQMKADAAAHSPRRRP